MPSLAQRVRQAPAGPASAPWDATRPAELESAAVSQPFRELKGVAIREVNEPDVFRHFFGALSVRASRARAAPRRAPRASLS